jgi:cell wall-associated NlpC family hydrolase
VTEEEERDAVVVEALSWVGTRYVHQSRLKLIGGDCTFFAKVYEKLGFVPEVPIPGYSPQAHLHRAAAIYEDLVGKYARRIDESQARRGDIVLYKFGYAFSHGAVLIEEPWSPLVRIVHGDLEARHILIGHGEGGRLNGQPRIFFTLWPRQ